MNICNSVNVAACLRERGVGGDGEGNGEDDVGLHIESKRKKEQ